MRKPKDVKIGEHTYTFGYWGPDEALGRLTKLIKICGEPIARIIVGATSGAKESGKGLDAELDEAKVIGDAISGLALKLNEVEVKAFFRECQDQMLCDNRQIEYKTHYMGRPGHLVKVTIQQLRHQYSDFLELMPVNGGLSSVMGTATQQETSL